MKRRPWRLLACRAPLAALLVLFGWPRSKKRLQTTPLPSEIRSGQGSITPGRGVAGEFGTWTVSYRVGETKIKTGGGLRVQLAEFWHSGPRNSAFRLQATSPRSDHYVSARCSNPAVALRTVVEREEDTPESWVKTLKPSNLTNRMGYYVYVVRVLVLKGEVNPGDTLSLIYGDRS